jgi:hypothetical protein
VYIGNDHSASAKNLTKISSKKKLKKVKLKKHHNTDATGDEAISEKTFRVEEVDEEENTHSPQNTNGKKVAAANQANA